MEFAINGRFLTQQVTGVQRYAASLLDAMDALLDDRPDISATVWSPPSLAAMPNWRNLSHRQAGRFGGNLWEQFDLPVLARGKLLFCPGNTSPVISLLGRQPVVVTVHDLSYSYFPEAYSRSFRTWYNLIVPLEMRRAASVLTVSEAERQSIVRHFPGAVSRVHAIANGGWPGELPEQRTTVESTSRGYVLYVGSLSKRKNFPLLLAAAIRLSRRRGFRFRFIGGTASSLAVSDHSVPDDVKGLIEFSGQVDDAEELGRAYREAACFVFPSLYESSGLPPVEAMAWGCPVIASDIPALRERCLDAALYCNPSDPSSVETSIENMMDSAEMRAEYRSRGYRISSSRTWDQCARKTLDLIRTNIEDHEASAPAKANER
jgi:glycosyltransferase involved in cell wall biosynthesis